MSYSRTPTKIIALKTWRLVFPLAISRLFNMLIGFIGMLMLARLGHTVLAAGALITATSGTLFVTSISFLFSIGAVVGHAFGAKRYNEIGGVLQQGWVLGMLIAVPVVVIQLSVGKILILFGQLPELAHIAQQYFTLYAIATPAFMLYIACQQVLLAVNQQRFVLFMSVVSLIGSVTLAYGFIYGNFGLPRLGVRGLSLAAAIQAWVTLLCYLAFCYFNKRFKHYEFFVWQIPNTFHILRKLFSIGWPISMQAAGDLLFFFVVTLLVGFLGEVALGARQIVVQFFLLLVVPIFSIAQAGTILIGQARGAEQHEDIRRYGNMAVLIGLGFSVVAFLAFVFFPRSLVGLCAKI